MPRRLLIGLPIWIVALLLFWWFVQTQEGGAVAWVERGLAGLAEDPWALAVLFGVYLIRPLLLLPMTVLTAFSGCLLGAFWGTVFGMVAVLASASIAYVVARFLGAGRAPTGPWWRRLRERSFETVITARLMMVPGDLVNYAAGALRVRYVWFAVATAVGGLPGLLIGIFAGASLQGVFRFEGVQIDVGYLVASVVLLVGSLTLSRWLRRRFGEPPR